VLDYILLKPAEKFLEKLQHKEQIRIIEALDSLISGDKSLDIKSLKGREGYRLRVGKHRILFREDQENNVYVITAIGSRGDIYK
jgi:mRNA interferase RelE/StbE